MKKYLILFFLAIAFELSAQELSTLPPSIKWQQIQSEHFKIIFPEGFESEANKTTNILENIYGPGSQSLGVQPRKFPVLLQNQKAISNGFVTIAPFRSEFFTFSPQSNQDLGNDHWLEHLASHEYRHMVQFEKAITPFNKVNYAFFGEYGPGFWAAVAAPSWFFEGDAVGAETAMGRTGRGRQPEFLMAWKANLIDKGGYHYYKQHLNSYSDFIPNHYVTGYLMTTHLKNHHGPDIWDKVVGNAFRKPFIPGTFSKSQKKYTGNNLIQNYNEMMAEQKDLYMAQLSKFEPSEYEIMNSEDRKTFTNYQYAIPFGDKILSIKSGLGDILQFVMLDQEGNEEVIHKLGIYNDAGFLSSNDSTVIWIEYEFDPRWYNKSYSVIKTLNIYSGELNRRTKKTRYSAAAISPDGTQIFAIAQSENSQNQLHILNKKGEQIKVIPNEENSFYSMPQFDSSGENIVMLKYKDEGKSVIKLDLSDYSKTELLYTEVENVGHPILAGDHIYYNSNFNGIDNIYSYNLITEQKSQITQSRFGAFNPKVSTNGQWLYYNDYSADGMNIVRTDLSNSDQIPFEKVENIDTHFEQVMVENEDIHEILYDAPDSTYQILKYSKLGNSIKPTTWSPRLSVFENEYGISATSQDLIATTFINAGVVHNPNENAWRTTANISYQGLYPIIDFGLDMGYRQLTISRPDGTSDYYKWNENTATVGLRIPLLLTNSVYRQKLTLSSSIEHTSISNYNVPPIDMQVGQSADGNLIALEHSISYYSQLGMSKLDLKPKWGYSLSGHLKQTPLGGDYNSFLVSGEGVGYMPGIFKHHSFYTKVGYQYQDIQNYFFQSPIAYTKGYSYAPYSYFTNIDVNYSLPIAYMDWHAGWLFNLQRIYANAFYNQGFVSNNRNNWDNIESVGADILFNFNMMRYLLEFEAGFRTSYIPSSGEVVFQFVLGGISF